ncbi:hypothetical protein K470DRAFT_241877 [Piedraia hortae CBS 480.64]|uniref:Nudix hydrolase domain-containing protein n=1 Tax=Piedraia hortae CBS 480.64 TaxID=1314780 RepID=A0A6A7C7C1_9PEZI|nr:hypothetical protein K470DRAFT_241877 [Piedraia hortae CBS 480.64]
MPTSPHPKPKTYLDLINECDNFPYTSTNEYYTLHVNNANTPGLGLILPSIAEKISTYLNWTLSRETQTLTLHGPDEASRTRTVHETFTSLREQGSFSILKGWRNELYSIYGADGSVLFKIERAASGLLGVVTYGCHMTCYMKEKGAEYRFWIPRRARTKETYPSMLDNSVAGGIAEGETPFSALVREAEEEASLSEAVVREGTRAAGAVTYFHVRDGRAGGEVGLLQPECQFVYDLDLTGREARLTPGDGEVEGFQLMGLEEVIEALRAGKFKPNCALVMLDFFVRHGIMTDTEEGYLEIVARLHRRLEFPMR